MLHCALVEVVAVLLAQAPVGAAQPDAVLGALVDEAVSVRPELAQARAQTRAARERAPQVRALPDPMLQVGVQNDSFDKWQVGKMETSWVLFMATQTFTFPGKPGLRGELADVDVQRRELAFERLRLTTVADMRRAYLALQLGRARLELLARLTSLQQTAVGAALARYETADGPQSDVLRARLELSRLRQQRLMLEADVRLQTQAINRLRHRPLTEAIEGAPALAQLAFPAVPELGQAIQEWRAHSPEYRAAGAEQAGATAAGKLASRSYFPDLTVGVGVMIRGALDPMWTVTVGVPVPVFAATKQSRSVAEANAQSEAARSGVEAMEQLLELRISQRLEYWAALRDVWASYEGGLLADAEAVSASTQNQYQVGKVPFAAVLEANLAAIATVEASLVVLADAWRLAIAHDERSLEETVPGAPAMGAPSSPNVAAGADESAGARSGM